MDTRYAVRYAIVRVLPVRVSSLCENAHQVHTCAGTSNDLNIGTKWLGDSLKLLFIDNDLSGERLFTLCGGIHCTVFRAKSGEFHG